jgi:RecB family endonuclease NucS
MLKIERQTRSFLRLQEPTLPGASITERYDLQEFIVNSPKEFLAEIGQKLFILGKEVRPSETVQDRIDILAIDQEGHAVVIELKRGNDRLQLLQAISYAGMLSKWQPADFLRLLDEERRKELIEKFLQVEEEEDINREQRIILVAEAYNYEALVGAEWLSEK